MTKLRKLQLAWKYRKLIRHRKAILAGALCAGIVAVVVVVATRPTRTSAA